ncbi:MAG: hypothetical protein JW833_03675 [Prolixibacteraceae bacterium]|nr:hypothetical protein [Prolixibacteraceae bacterium]
MELSEAARQARNTYQREYKKVYFSKPENKEKLRKAIKRWRHAHPDKVRAQNERYWERKAAQAVTITAADNVTGVTINNSSDTSTNNTVTTVTCLECGKEFTPKRSTARFCSDKCRVRYNRRLK